MNNMTDTKFKILYIFPHPDDESFGPSTVMHQQLKEGHEVYLLTLTKGEATKQRFKLGIDKKEMGEIRYQEMLKVEKTLGLTKMEVLDMPDSLMKEMDPREIEKVVEEKVREINPHIVVTYPVHGISGFHDHIVMHAVTKRVFMELKDEKNLNWKRLAFMTLPNKTEKPFMEDGGFRMKHTEEELIDCITELSDDDIYMMKQTLSCYDTYKDIIEESGVVDKIGDKMYFEFYMEDFNPPLSKVTEKMGVKSL